MARVSRKRMRSGNNTDFHRFYLDHIDRVYRFVFFRVGNNTQVAEDLTSEIFMKALKAFETYDPKKSKHAWITTIAKNHLANWYRDTKHVEDIDDIAFKQEGENLNDTMEKRSDEDVLYKALAKLKPDDREIVEMKHLQGYRFKEIAEMIGKSPGAVRVKCHRAMEKLKKLIQV
jgi:RNA polymerase sigma factor (sigma-70 family)